MHVYLQKKMNIELSSSALMLMMLSQFGDYTALKTVTQLKRKVSLKDVEPHSEYVGCTVMKTPQAEAVDVAIWFDYNIGKDFLAIH